MHAAEFVASYFDAWNHHDPKGVADHLSSDGIYLDVPLNQRRSHDEFIEYLRGFFQRYRHRYELVGEILRTRNTIAFQYRMVQAGGDGQRGAPSTYHGAEFVTLHGDAAISITDYYDIPITSARHKYAKSGLTSEQSLALRHRLDRIMRHQKAYLRPDLNLPMLAQLAGCSINHLSQVINSGFGTNFFGYLNRYRIRHARELLSDLDSRDMAILDVAFSAGFNSNSAFYSAFKKHLGVSPTQYRRERLGKRHQGA